MKRIIFLRKTPANPIKTQDSVWKDMKDPINVIWKMILVLIAISPIFSVYSILSYLGDYGAKIIGFSLFSNIYNLGAVFFYSFVFYGVYFLLLFIFPFFFGYLYYTYSDELSNSNCTELSFTREGVIIVIGVIIIAIGIMTFLNLNFSPIRIAIIIIILYILWIVLLYLFFKPIKHKYSPIPWLVYTYLSSSFFLMVVSILHKNILRLAFFNAIYFALIFIIGIQFGKSKKIIVKRNNRHDIEYIIIMLIGTFIIGDLTIFKIPFPKIAISYSGIGDQKTTFILKPNTPIYLKKQLLNIETSTNHAKQSNLEHNKVKANQYVEAANKKTTAKKILKPKLQTTPLFLLIQTSKYFYVEKYEKRNKNIPNKKDIIKLPKKYVTNIIPPKLFR